LRLQAAFRLPSTAYSQLIANTSVFSFLKGAMHDAKSKSALASIGLSMVESAIGSTHAGKLFKELESAAAKDAARRDALK
jgi:hypothetical protein